VGVGRGADMALTGFHPLWDKNLSQNLQAIADQGCHLEGSSPYKGIALGGFTVFSAQEVPSNLDNTFWNLLREMAVNNNKITLSM
jgi:hypothetical protein